MFAGRDPLCTPFHCTTSLSHSDMASRSLALRRDEPELNAHVAAETGKGGKFFAKKAPGFKDLWRRHIILIPRTSRMLELSCQPFFLSLQKKEIEISMPWNG